MRRVHFTAFIAVMAMTGLGCSGSQTPGVYPVQGSVTVNGEPAEYANVILIPAEPNSDLPRAYGVVDASGKFQLSTVGQFDGAEPGEYFVTISWTKPKNPKASEPDYGPELLPAMYQDPVKSGLKVQIEPGTNKLEPFELKKK